jgi:hypothetical protein
MTSTKTPDQAAVVIPADAYRAFADFLSAGNTGSFDDWFASDAGKTALVAFQDQATAAAKSTRMADAKALWRDFKNNGEVTVYAKAHAARLLAYLSTVDFDAIVASTDATTAEATAS